MDVREKNISHAFITQEMYMGIKKRVEKEEFIEKGGKVSTDNTSMKEWVNFNLRVRKDMFEKMDSLLERRIGISKTAWILEAIQEKIRRDE